MIEWLESLSTPAAGTLVVGGIVAISLLCAYVVDRLSPREVRMEHNDLAGFILAVIGVIYAVLLAFITIGVWERFEQATARSYEEAAAIVEVYRDAPTFTGGRALRSALRDYVQHVVTDEWPKMQQGQESPAVDAKIERIDAMVRALPVTTREQQDVHDQMLVGMNAMLSERDARLSEDATGINGIMWMVLIVGALITIGFTSLFGFRRDIMQYVMIGLLSLLIGLVFYLVLALDYPYRGNIIVEPTAFRSALHTFDVLGP